jgi:hypothetical protein
MAVQGVFASDQHIVGNRAGDFASGILQTQPNGSAPMLALTSGMQSAPASDTIINWFEEVHLTGRTGVASFVTDGDGVGIVVDDGSEYVAGTVLLVEETGEYLLVTTAATNTLTVTRGIGGTTATTITTSHNLQKVGNGHAEGSAMPPSIVNIGDVRFNVTQIFRNSWSVTGTVRAITYHTGNQVAKNRADCAVAHAEDIERSLLWGVYHIGTLSGQPFRLMNGLVTQAINHGATVEAQSANTKWSDLKDHLRQVFANNIKGKPNERIAFCGNSVLGVVDRLAELNGTINITPGQTEFGLNVTKIISPYGNVTLMTHPLMNENALWSKAMYTFHPGAIRMRWLRKTQIEGYDKNGSRIAGVDADQGVYTSELSVELGAAQTSGIYTGIDTAAAEA